MPLPIAASTSCTIEHVADDALWRAAPLERRRHVLARLRVLRRNLAAVGPGRGRQRHHLHAASAAAAASLAGGGRKGGIGRRGRRRLATLLADGQRRAEHRKRERQSQQSHGAISSAAHLNDARLRLAPGVVAHAKGLDRIQVLPFADDVRPVIRRRLRHGEIHRVLAVVVRIAVGVALLRHQDVGDVRGLLRTRDRRLRAVGRPGRAGAAAVAARSVRRFHRGHHAIGHRAFGVEKRLHGIGHHGAGPQNVPLNRIEDLGARHLTVNVLRHVAISEARVPRAPSLQIDDAELARLKGGIGAQLLDDRLRIGAFLQFAKHEHLILVRVVDAGLACRHAHSGHDDRLHAHQELIVAIDAGRRRDHDATRTAIDGNHRPGRRRCRRHGDERRAGTEPHDA